MNISYKPQKISPKFQGSVRALIMARIREAAVHPQFNTDVLKPLQIEQLMDQEVRVSFFNVPVFNLKRREDFNILSLMFVQIFSLVLLCVVGDRILFDSFDLIKGAELLAQCTNFSGCSSHRFKKIFKNLALKNTCKTRSVKVTMSLSFDI